MIMQGIVSDILSFSLNDGPGIRTTVFLKGCPLRCAWCHNPETAEKRPQVLYAAHLCVGCGGCASVCPVHARKKDGSWVTDGTACVGCGECARVCPAKACRLVGQTLSAEEAARRVLKDKPFFREKGGVTFSGGEPLMQADFVRECAGLLKAAGIHTAAETSLCASPDVLRPMADVIDLWLCDWKLTDPDAHLRYTGADNRRVRENLLLLSGLGARIILRCPIIPGTNDTKAHFVGIAALAGELKTVGQVDLLPYHSIGNDKRKKLGVSPDGFRVPDEDEKGRWLKALREICPVPVNI